MKYIKNVYNSFLLSLTIATLCFSNDWLQMRVNTGYIFGALLVVFIVVFYVFDRKKNFVPGWKFTTGNLIICTVIGLVLYGWRRMQVVSAALIREGLGQRTLPFSVVNRVLCVVVVVGLGVILWSDYKRYKN